jgi:hypothetical protein
MSRAKTTYRLVDLTNAMKAMRAAGLTISQTRIAPDGTITLVHSGSMIDQQDVSPDDHLAIWQASRERSA